MHDNANRYINLQIAVAQDVAHELADHQMLISFARLGDIRRGVDTLRAHIQRVSRNLIVSLAEGRDGKVRDIA